MTRSAAALKQITPILRMFDEAKAKQFYVDFLGFRIDWEHRFEDNLPLYMQISLGECTIHLSEHHGDGCPGSALRIAMTGIRAYHAALLEKQYKFARPRLETAPWNELQCTVHDPFGNRLVFYEPVEGA